VLFAVDLDEDRLDLRGISGRRGADGGEEPFVGEALEGLLRLPDVENDEAVGARARVVRDEPGGLRLSSQSRFAITES